MGSELKGLFGFKELQPLDGRTVHVTEKSGWSTYGVLVGDTDTYIILDRISEEEKKTFRIGVSFPALVPKAELSAIVVPDNVEQASNEN